MSESFSQSLWHTYKYLLFHLKLCTCTGLGPPSGPPPAVFLWSGVGRFSHPLFGPQHHSILHRFKALGSPALCFGSRTPASRRRPPCKDTQDLRTAWFPVHKQLVSASVVSVGSPQKCREPRLPQAKAGKHVHQQMRRSVKNLGPRFMAYQSCWQLSVARSGRACPEI